MKTVEIRETTKAEIVQILALYPLAFPEEELRPLVTALIEYETGILSLASFDMGQMLAHVIFTHIGTSEENGIGALLGPLCVLPEKQRLGLGTQIVRDGLARLERSAVRQVFVLGDPDYYGRFGFQPERHVLPPYELPAEWSDAWQSMVLTGRQPLAPGRCSMPAPWMDPALW